MSTPIVQLLSKTVNAFFNNGEVQREVCKIARRCSKAAPASGTTRPTEPLTGEMFFDSTLGQPIWYDGVDWVDSTGTPVE